MLLKVYLISTILAFIFYLSECFLMGKEERDSFSKEELKKWKEYKKKKGRDYPFFIFFLLFTLPVVNVVFAIFGGFMYKEIKDKIFLQIRIANGKMNLSETVANALYKAFTDVKGGIEDED